MPTLRMNKAPLDSDTHTWTDYLELLALVNMDRLCTTEMAVDRVSDVVQEETDAHSDDDGDGEEGIEPLPSERRRGLARDRARFQDALAMAAWRMETYGECYPFLVDESERTVTLADELTELHKLYIFLLTASNLRFVTTGYSELTNSFEEVCAKAFKALLPRAAEVHVFGKATAVRYSGSAESKLSKLCEDIRATYLALPEDFRDGDTGDSGIDLVAWHGLRDQAGNIFVYLGQCACSRSDWPKKQLAASPQALRSSISSSPDWTTVMFVPLCFRRIGGAWAFKSEVAGVVFMDRFRIAANLDRDELGQLLPMLAPVVESITSNVEELV